VILNVKSLLEKDLEDLAKLFDELEAEVRRLGGVDEAENVFGSELVKDLTDREDVKGGVQGIFNTVIKKIDEKVAGILGMEALVEPIREMVLNLARRRLSRASGARPDIFRGSGEPLRRARRRKGEAKVDEDVSMTRLTDFM
jgi:hypothetical protein